MPALGVSTRMEQPLSEPRQAAPRETEPMRATAHLPGLDVEIIHRRSPEDDCEQISITMRAVPSFAAFEQYLRAMNPFAFWMETARLVWAPWLQATRTTALPFVDSPRLTKNDPHAGTDKPK
jgi:hypothetical protein